jgi:hypothetical protein
MKNNHSIAAAAMLLMLTSNVYAQDVRGGGAGGGVILDASGRLRLEDLVKRSLCKQDSFLSLVARNKDFNSVVSSIESKNWFLADFFKREAAVLKVCFTGRLKEIPFQNEYLAQYGEEKNWQQGFVREQLGVRIGDTVFINQALYNLPEKLGGLPESDIAIFLIHEIAHGIIPDAYNGQERSTLVSQFAAGIYQNYTSLMNLDSFDELIRSNGIQMPLSTELNRFVKYRKSMQQAFMRTSTIQERYQALAMIPLRDLADWIQPVERAHLVQRSTDELKNARRIIRSVDAQSSPRKIKEALAELKIEINRGILPSVLTYTNEGVQSLLEEASRALAHRQIIEYLKSVKTESHYDENDDRFESSAKIYFSRDPNSQFKTLKELLDAGMTINVKIERQPLLVYLAAAKNWSAVSEVMNYADQLSDAAVLATLPAAAKLAETGDEALLIKLLDLKRSSIDSRLLLDSIQSNQTRLFLQLLSRFTATELDQVLDSVQGDTIGHRLARLHPGIDTIKQQNLRKFFMLPQLNVNQKNRTNRNLIEVALDSRNSFAVGCLLRRGDTQWTPNSFSDLTVYYQTKSYFSTLIHEYQIQPDAVLLNSISQQIVADKTLSKIDWIFFKAEASLGTGSADLVKILDAKIATFQPKSDSNKAGENK